MKIKISACFTLCVVLVVILLTMPTLSGCNNNPSNTNPTSDSDVQVQNTEIQQESAPLTSDDVKLMLENG